MSIILEDGVLKDEYYIVIHFKITRKNFKFQYATLGVSECLFTKHIYRILSYVITYPELLGLVFVAQEFIIPSSLSILVD